MNSVKCDLRIIALILSGLHLVLVNAGEITESEHRTKAATEKLPTLVCYRCNNMVDGDDCSYLKDNSSLFHANCSDNARICQVKRISMTSINKTGDVIGKPTLWMLQRNCTATCDPGCVIIGERTKLYSCTTCCEESLCNSGSSADSVVAKRRFELDLLCFYIFNLILMMKT